MAKLSIKGVNPNGANPNQTITIMTLSNISDSVAKTLNENSMDEIMSAIQDVTSASITSAEISMGYGVTEELTPANELEMSEIFQAEYSDTTAIPTLKLTFSDGDTSKSANIKYMGDPINTSEYEDKIIALGTVLNNKNLITQNLTKAEMKLTATDEVYEIS